MRVELSRSRILRRSSRNVLLIVASDVLHADWIIVALVLSISRRCVSKATLSASTLLASIFASSRQILDAVCLLQID